MMAGSSLYRIASETYGRSVTRLSPLVMHVVATIAMIGMFYITQLDVIIHYRYNTNIYILTTMFDVALGTFVFYHTKFIVYICFLLFEICCGVFFPGIVLHE
jgi:hypothetical protein